MSEEKMTAEELQEALGGFTGTELWHSFSVLYPHLLLTDGAQFLADQAGAYWLMDIIGSYNNWKFREENYFQVWKLKRTEGTRAVVTCDDGNGNILKTQGIEYTDFPLQEIKLYCIWDEPTQGIILLTSEY